MKKITKKGGERSGTAPKNRSRSHGGGEGQLIIDVILLGPMAINPFPVLCECFEELKRAKTTRIQSKDDKIIKDSHYDFLLIFFFDQLTSCSHMYHSEFTNCFLPIYFVKIHNDYIPFFS